MVQNLNLFNLEIILVTRARHFKSVRSDEMCCWAGDTIVEGKGDTIRKIQPEMKLNYNLENDLNKKACAQY